MKEKLIFIVPSLLLCIVRKLWTLPLLESHRSFLFYRGHEKFECLVDEHKWENDVANRKLVNEEDMDVFARDGAILLRDVISKDWLRVYRQLLNHVFHNPNTWDMLYSRMVANFYGAQKSIFLHQSGACGRYIGSNSPATRIASEFFRHQHQESPSKLVQLRIIEPTEALINYGNGDGHTSWHRDDPYMHYKQGEHQNSENLSDKNNTVVIRIWIPLMDMRLSQMKFLALNNSVTSMIEREKNGIAILGTNFSQFDDIASSNLTNGQIIGPGEKGYRAGDAFVFAGDTPHFAQGLNCSSVGCARLIFSFALDGKAVYDSSKKTTLLPLYSGQENGKPLRGKQFPLIFPKASLKNQDWEDAFDFVTYGDVFKSMWHAIEGGVSSFAGLNWKKALPYFVNVRMAIQENVWVKPDIDLDSGK